MLFFCSFSKLRWSSLSLGALQGPSQVGQQVTGDGLPQVQEGCVPTEDVNEWSSQVPDPVGFARGSAPCLPRLAQEAQLPSGCRAPSVISWESVAWISGSLCTRRGLERPGLRVRLGPSAPAQLHPHSLCGGGLEAGLPAPRPDLGMCPAGSVPP